MRVISFILFGSFITNAQAQTKLSLAEAWQKGIQNPTIKQKSLELEVGNIDLALSKEQLLPNISGQYNNSLNIGRSIDPYTNSFLTQSIVGNNYGLSANYTLFDFYQNKNQIAINQLYLKAIGQDLKAIENDIKYRILVAFSEVLLAEEQAKTSQSLIHNAEENLTYLKKLYAADRIRYSLIVTLEAELLRLKTDQVQAIANTSLAKLSLQRLIGLPSEINLELTNRGVLLQVKPLNTPMEIILEEAISNLPEFENLKYQKIIKTKESAMLLAQKWPTFIAFSNIGTTYSSAARRIEKQELVKINYPKQFGDNLNMNVGFSVRFPLFNVSNYDLKNQKKQIELKGINIQSEAKKLEIRGIVEESFTRLEATVNREKILEERIASLETVEKINQNGFEEGRVEFSEYLQSKRDLEQAKLQINILKYQYFVLIKQLEFYRTGTWQ